MKRAELYRAIRGTSGAERAQYRQQLSELMSLPTQQIHNNRCGDGACSKCYTYNEVADCVASALPGWNGRCPYQDGNICGDNETPRDSNGQFMSREEYIKWK